MQKTLEEKLAECRMVYAHNIESTITGDMVYKYLKEEKFHHDVKSHKVNHKDGILKLEFETPEKARQYYQQANFLHKVLVRPFNLYFSLYLKEDQIKKYYLDGLTDKNLRPLFEQAMKIAMCKIYTSYTKSSAKAKVKPTGVLSFIKKEEIPRKDYKNFQEKLSDLGIQIYLYRPDKGNKCSLAVTDFYDIQDDQNENEIKERAKEKLELLLKSMGNIFQEVENISVHVKIKDEEDFKNSKVRGFVEFHNSVRAIENFEEVRKGFLNEGKARALLNFHNSQSNSYISLFTSGLENKKNLIEKQFEDELVRDFRKVNEEVVQVNVFPVEHNNTFVGRVYLKNEDAGKDFIVDYTSKKEQFAHHYKNEQNIRFNINVDDKTMRRIKAMEKAANQIAHQVKKEEEEERRPKRYGNNSGGMPRKPQTVRTPLHVTHPFNPNNMPPISNLPQQPGVLPPVSMPPMGNVFPMSNIPPMGNMPPLMPPMGSMTPPPMGNVPQLGMPLIPMSALPQSRTNDSAIETKIERILKDREQIEKISSKDAVSEKQIKNGVVMHLKYVLQHRCAVPACEVAMQADKILCDNGIKAVFDFLEKPEEFYSEVYSS